jgi:hypothetical protein
MAAIFSAVITDLHADRSDDPCEGIHHKGDEGAVAEPDLVGDLVLLA